MQELLRKCEWRNCEMMEKTNLTMLTDFYEITMANGYFCTDMADNIACFDMFFRRIPDEEAMRSWQGWSR